MHKPLHSRQAVARGIQILENSIATKEQDLRGQRNERDSFRQYILLHELYARDPDSMKKPPYRLASLQDGVRQIEMNIRKLEEMIQVENGKLRQFYQISAAHTAYAEWAKDHLQEASGVIEISAEMADEDPDFMKTGE